MSTADPRAGAVDPRPNTADLSTLAVGDELPTLELRPISRATLAMYAGASGDDNPIHIDIDAAHAAGLGDVFAHGVLSMAYLARLLTDTVPQERLRSFGVRFVAITPVHARPHCEARVAAIDDGTAELALRVVLEDGTVTVTGTATIDLR